MGDADFERETSAPAPTEVGVTVVVSVWVGVLVGVEVGVTL